MSVLNSMGLVPSWVLWALCHHALFFLVGISWVHSLFSWVFCGSQFFSCGSEIFFSWVFRGSKFFSRRCFVGTSWIHKWGIRNKCCTPAPINTEKVYLKIIVSNFSTHTHTLNAANILLKKGGVVDTNKKNVRCVFYS